jgi:hypothetical protein
MHCNLQQRNLFMIDDLHVSTFAPMAVLVGNRVVIYKWAVGPKPIET